MKMLRVSSTRGEADAYTKSQAARAPDALAERPPVVAAARHPDAADSEDAVHPDADPDADDEALAAAAATLAVVLAAAADTLAATADTLAATADTLAAAATNSVALVPDVLSTSCIWLDPSPMECK